MAKVTAHPYLTRPDHLVLENLFKDVKDNKTGTDDAASVAALSGLNDPQHPTFEPTVTVTWDLPALQQNVWFSKNVLQPYIRFIQAKVVRHPTDVVFATHICLILCTSLPSALWLFHHFTYLHGVAHVAWTFW